MESNIYKRAARKDLTFTTNRGTVGVSDLFKFPLPSLDLIYRQIAPTVAAQDTGLMRQRADTDNELRLEIVKDVFETLQAESDAAEARRANKEKKLQILQIMERKQGEDLASKSMEELSALLESL